jgi:hypothetical protein
MQEQVHCCGHFFFKSFDDLIPMRQRWLRFRFSDSPSRDNGVNWRLAGCAAASHVRDLDLGRRRPPPSALPPSPCLASLARVLAEEGCEWRASPATPTLLRIQRRLHSQGARRRRPRRRLLLPLLLRLRRIPPNSHTRTHAHAHSLAVLIPRAQGLLRSLSRCSGCWQRHSRHRGCSPLRRRRPPLRHRAHIAIDAHHFCSGRSPPDPRPDKTRQSNAPVQRVLLLSPPCCPPHKKHLCELLIILRAK